MLFTENVFITQFLPIVLIVSIALQLFRLITMRHLWLIASSILFYAWFKIEYLPILLGSLLCNYFLAFFILQKPQSQRSKKIMILGVVLNLGLLAVYKYLGFIVFNLNEFLAVGLPSFDVLLPLAISFFTFQQISYLVDAHSGKLKAEEHRFTEYMLFVTFFPQLVAGPIVHHAEMMPQFRQTMRLDLRLVLFVEGCLLFACGLFKKLAIADSIAPTADRIFGIVDNAGTIDIMTAWVGALAYTFQIYFDFSGYSDMAIGLGLMFGIRLPWNFNSPYKASNISEFWRRWHMSLSRWLRDYLYVPLGGNRHGKFNQYRNNFLTMVLGGLWHGAHWNFIIWGALHGVYLIINQLIRFCCKTLGIDATLENSHKFKLLGIATTFFASVIAWVFFRATSTEGAFEMIAAMFAFQTFNNDASTFTNLEIYLILVAAFVAFFAPNTKEFSKSINQIFEAGWASLFGRIFVGGLTGSAAAVAFIASQSTTQSPFLYFNF